MSQSNTAIDKKNGKTRQCQEPIENIPAVRRQVDEGQASKEQLKEDNSKGASFLVNVSENLGTHACV